MLIPIRTDRRLSQFPWATCLLIGINALVFVLTSRSREAEASVGRLILNPAMPEVYQFLSYQFLHADFMHLAGNMLFLYVFGTSVEDRLGVVGYLAFYLAGGVAAGLAHCLVEAAPVLGASGSVAAVTGAFLALFPMSRVTIVYFLFFIGLIEISSIYLILFQIAIDAFYFLGNFGGVAYLAHLGGYAFGFLVGMVLLWTRLLPREPYDMLTMIAHRRRRAEFNRMAREGYTPWQWAGSKAIPGKTDGAIELSPKQQEMAELRATVSAAVAAGQEQEIAAGYQKILDADAAQVLPRRTQLDMANLLMAAGNHALAIRGYEGFLQMYPRDSEATQVRLVLALLLLRYEHNPARAAELLDQADPDLHDDEQRALASQLREELG